MSCRADDVVLFDCDDAVADDGGAVSSCWGALAEEGGREPSADRARWSPIVAGADTAVVGSVAALEAPGASAVGAMAVAAAGADESEREAASRASARTDSEASSEASDASGSGTAAAAPHPAFATQVGASNADAPPTPSVAFHRSIVISFADGEYSSDLQFAKRLADLRARFPRWRVRGVAHAAAEPHFIPRQPPPNRPSSLAIGAGAGRTDGAGPSVAGPAATRSAADAAVAGWARDAAEAVEAAASAPRPPFADSAPPAPAVLGLRGAAALSRRNGARRQVGGNNERAESDGHSGGGSGHASGVSVSASSSLSAGAESAGNVAGAAPRVVRRKMWLRMEAPPFAGRVGRVGATRGAEGVRLDFPPLAVAADAADADNGGDAVLRDAPSAAGGGGVAGDARCRASAWCSWWCCRDDCTAVPAGVAAAAEAAAVRAGRGEVPEAPPMVGSDGAGDAAGRDGSGGGVAPLLEEPAVGPSTLRENAELAARVRALETALAAALRVIGGAGGDANLAGPASLLTGRIAGVDGFLSRLPPEAVRAARAVVLRSFTHPSAQ